jgi:3-hydroxyisobutyrate dehydrogenase
VPFLAPSTPPETGALKICQSMAAKNAARVPLVEQTLLDYEKLIKEGFADEDISALFRLK